MMPHRRRAAAGILAIALAGGLLGCSGENPLDFGESPAGSSITVGSTDTHLSQILAQVYGQVLANAGYTVDYNLAIGDRETFIPALADGAIDLMPDYSGSLLYGADPEATATSAEDVVAALPEALRPLGLRVLTAAEAQDADALVVTPEFSVSNNVLAIGDLAVLGGGFALGADADFEDRKAQALASVYGVSGYTFTEINDHGGATTVQSLLNRTVQVADLHTANPAIAQNNLVVLADPEGLIVAQNVVPVLDADLYSERLAGLLNSVTAKLTTVELTTFITTYNSDSKPSAASIATGWLTANGYLPAP